MADRTGMICLHPDPKDAVALAATTIDIVAVHGFLGDRVDTWTHEKSKKCWLRDFLPHDIKGARVLSFGYSTGIGIRSSTARIDDHAGSLLDAVVNSRSKLKESRPIIFIAHSLGGLVVKLALNKAHNQLALRHKAVLTNTAGILFFGTPHKGAAAAQLARSLDSFASKVMHQPNSPLLKEMETKNTYLFDMSHNFIALTSEMTIVSFYETHVTKPGNSVIVERESVFLGLPVERNSPVEADHQQMCKFEDFEKETYKTVVLTIEDMQNAAPSKNLDAATASNSASAVSQQEPLLMGPRTLRLHSKFIERPDMTKAIDRCFFPEDSGEKASRTVSSILLYGIPGSGKSQLAHGFFRQRAEKFYHRFWVDASSRKSIEHDFEAIARAAGLENSAIETVVTWFERQQNSWLLVLDNVDPSASARKYFPDEGYGSVLMTAQRMCEAGDSALEVKGFSREQGLEFLKRITERDETVGQGNATIFRLIERLSSNPLALDIAGTYIRKQKFSFQDYLKRWEQKIFQNHENYENATGYSRSLAEAFKMTFDQVSGASQASDDSSNVPTSANDQCSADAIELLKFFSFLHPESASEHVLRHAWDFMYRRDKGGAIAARHAQETWLDVLMKTEEMEWEPVFARIREALALLSDWSLLTFDGSHKVYVHSLVQICTLQEIDDQDRRQWYSRMAIILATNGADKRSDNANLASHLQHLAKMYPSMPITDVPWPFEDEEFKVASIWADIYKESAYYQEARDLRQKVCDELDRLINRLATDRRTDKTEYCRTLQLYFYSLRDLGGSCHDTGDHDSALEQYEKAITKAEQLQNRHRPDPALNIFLWGCQSHKARELQCLGDYEAAYEQRLEAWKSWSKKGKDPQWLREVLSAFQDWASSSIDVGRYAKAIATLQQLISFYHGNREFEPDDKDFLLARSELGRAYSLDQKHEEAWKEYVAVRTLRLKSSEDHPETLIAAEGVATSLSNLGKDKEALQLRVATLAQWKALPSQKNQQFQNFLAAKYNLARSYEDVGYYESALIQHKEVLQSRLALLRDNKHEKECCPPIPKKPDDWWEFVLALLNCHWTYKHPNSDITDSLETITFVLKKSGSVDSSTSYYKLTEHMCRQKLDVQVLGNKSSVASRSRREALACWNRLTSWHDSEDEKIRRRREILDLQTKYFGHAHSDALITAIDLGRDYWQRGDPEAGKRHAKWVLSKEKSSEGAYSNIFQSARTLLHDIHSNTRQVEQTAAHPQQPAKQIAAREVATRPTSAAPRYRREISANPAMLPLARMNGMSLSTSIHDELFKQLFATPSQRNGFFL